VQQQAGWSGAYIRHCPSCDADSPDVDSVLKHISITSTFVRATCNPCVGHAYLLLLLLSVVGDVAVKPDSLCSALMSSLLLCFENLL
jgi:hypothetical protein